jgi:hypothetical protein
MKKFIDWYYENNKSIRITIDGIRVVIFDFCTKETMEMAIECGCNGVSTKDSGVQFQFPI